MLNIYEPLYDDFNQYLLNDNSKRVLFSGKFGIGKTTFLKEFFRDNPKEYNVIHLYPVSYAIQSNEDVLRLIKFDILTQLVVKHKVSFSQIKLTEVDYLPIYARNHMYKILLPILLWKGGKMGLKLYNTLKSELEEFAKKYKEETASDSDVVDVFTDSILDEEGNIYERNILTEIIVKGLQSLTEENDKKNILIIDDLDRLDPKHLFRILNVFASQFDLNEDYKEIFGENKFGFDRILFVCDLDNVRSIFEHFYGSKTDFNGYIDKFYSSYIYKFDSSDNIISVLENILTSFNVTLDGGVSVGIERGFKVEKLNSRFTQVLNEYVKPILIYLLKSQTITIRSIAKYLDKPIVLKSKKLNIRRYLKPIDSYELDFCMAIDFFTAIFGSYESFIAALKKTVVSSYERLDLGRTPLASIPAVVLLAEFHKFDDRVFKPFLEGEIYWRESGEEEVDSKESCKFVYKNFYPELKCRRVNFLPQDFKGGEPKLVNPIYLMLKACEELDSWNGHSLFWI